MRLLAFGEFKHISAFAWVRPYGMWVYYNITLFGTKIVLLPDSEQATAWIASQTLDADLVQFRRVDFRDHPVGAKKSTRPMIAPFYCVSAVKHLIGLRCGALLVTTLYRHVLANGGELVTDGRARTSDAEPGAVAPATGSP